MDSEKTLFDVKGPTHPGDVVVEYLEALGWSQSDLARRTGITPKTISEICNGKAAITPQTSLAFEKVLQRPAHLWLNLQRQHDETEARSKEGQRSADWLDWLKRFPIREMKQLNLLPSGGADSELDSLLSFLGVSSPKAWKDVWESSAVAFRQTRRFATTEEAVSVWVRQTELIASAMDVADFSDSRLRASVEELRACTRLRIEKAVEKVQRICADAGVAVVWFPALKHTGISGCARWLGERKALVGLSCRYKTDDQMWFTLFHELAHLILHRRKRSFVLDNAHDTLVDRVVDPEMQGFEDEANRFSADALIPPKEFTSFIARNDFDNDAIHAFAEAVGVGPGLVVGRLQFEGLLEHYQGNALKQRLDMKATAE